MPRLGEEMRPALLRFLDKIQKGSSGECWTWIGALDGEGYGRIGYKRKVVRAHRLSVMLFKGPIPKGKLVMHACDNPKCVNPVHLSIGTDLENTRDCISKGRKRAPGMGRLWPRSKRRTVKTVREK